MMRFVLGYSSHRATRILLAAAVCVLCGLLLALAVPMVAGAATFAWSGEAAAKVSPGWSEDANWQGGLAPSTPGPVTLEFPRLAGASCASSSPLEACYESDDDLSSLQVEALDIDDGADYTIEGGPIALGVGGISASVAEGSSGAAGDSFGAPIALTAPQTWTVAQPSGQPFGEHGVAIEEGIEGGRNALTIDLEHGPVLYLFGDVETGSLVFDGIGSGSEPVVEYEGALDSSGEEPVGLTNVLLAGRGSTGPIEVHTAKLFPTPKIEAEGVTLEGESEIVFELDGTKPGVSYSQLDASGAVDLAGAKIAVQSSASCYRPKEGTVFTLVTTTGPLSGSFGKGDRDEYVPIAADEAAGCFNLGQSLEIAYHETGATETVTGTVVNGYPIPALENTVKPFEIVVTPVEGFPGEPATPKTSIPPAPQKALLRLLSTRLAVKRGAAIAKLGCSGGGMCAGKVLLTADIDPKAGHRHASTVRVGELRYSLDANTVKTVKIELNPRGRALLHAARGRITAELAISASAGTSASGLSRF
jgi:hypothetical protein